jgi:hypothetical protein
MTIEEADEMLTRHLMEGMFRVVGPPATPAPPGLWSAVVESGPGYACSCGKKPCDPEAREHFLVAAPEKP